MTPARLTKCHSVLRPAHLPALADTCPGAAGDQFLEVANISVGLYGGAGLGAGVRDFPGRPSAGV